jgi:hypothetical protein
MARGIRPAASRCDFDPPSGALRPDRRPIAMDKAIAYPNDLSERAIAQALRPQVQA